MPAGISGELSDAVSSGPDDDVLDLYSTTSPSYGSSLRTPEEGEIGWGPTQTFEPWGESGWHEDPTRRVRISNDGKTATAVFEMTCVAVLGERTLAKSLHAWTVIIEVSRLNYGGAICIGVTDADATITADRGGWSCGFNPYCGALFVTGDANKVNYKSPAHNLMHGDLQGKANKAQITVMVDMDQRQLAFSINGGPSVLATKAGGLPSKVRPWVHLFKEHDSVTISPPQGLSAGGASSSSGQATELSSPEETKLPRSCNTSFGNTTREELTSTGSSSFGAVPASALNERLAQRHRKSSRETEAPTD
jgi:hypothetical protein